MPHLPVVTIKRPAILAGQSNGRLDPAILHSWTPPWSGTRVQFVEPAMRCYKALVTAAFQAGFVFISVGSYRTYQRQVELFNQRYRRVQFETGIFWDGSYWVHETGAVAAIPGTSNHGWGLADDLGEQRDSDPAAESISDRAVAWLIANEQRFGISHERQDEPWHVRATEGDNIPAAVLAFERGDDDLTPEERQMLVELHRDRQVAPWQYRNAQGVAEWARDRPGQWYPDMHAVLWDTKRRVDALAVGGGAEVDYSMVRQIIREEVRAALGDVTLDLGDRT